MQSAEEVEKHVPIRVQPRPAQADDREESGRRLSGSLRHDSHEAPLPPAATAPHLSG